MNLWKVSLLVSLMKRFCEKFHLLGFINKTKQIFWHLTCPGPWAASRWRFVFLRLTSSSCFLENKFQFHIINKIETWFVLFFWSIKIMMTMDDGFCAIMFHQTSTKVCVCVRFRTLVWHWNWMMVARSLEPSSDCSSCFCISTEHTPMNIRSACCSTCCSGHIISTTICPFGKWSSRMPVSATRKLASLPSRFWAAPLEATALGPTLSLWTGTSSCPSWS